MPTVAVDVLALNTQRSSEDRDTPFTVICVVYAVLYRGSRVLTVAKLTYRLCDVAGR